MITDDNFDKDDIVDQTAAAVFRYNHGAVLSDETQVGITWAVDATLRYVVEWLRSTGHSAKAEILESIGEVDE